MNIICRKKRLICSEDPGVGVIYIRLRPHKEFPETMQAITQKGKREYPLPKGFNPKKIEGVQYVPSAVSLTHEEKIGEKENGEGFEA
jgi:hypothetical protein